MRKIAFTAVLLVCVLLGLGGAAQADTINSLTVTGYTVTSGVNVTLNGQNLGTKYGAQFNVHLGLGNNNFQDVIAYCVDLYQTIGTGTYTGYSLNPVSESGSTQAAAWLLGHYAPGLGNPYAPNSLTTTITALQVAIWEVTYDYSSSGSYALGGGNFKASGLTTAVANLANSYLTALSGANPTLTGLQFSGVARSGANQDLIVGNTPEPGSMILFGSAAGLMGWLRRRRQAKQRLALAA
ncbi:MAG: PEP-CTERM sorting domain-containing protein [Desulfarculus sp.]|nr:PEP-CTERM sorting domain-containing protein [Desulfarculus sp.]